MNPDITRRLEVIAFAVGAAIVVASAMRLLGASFDLKEAASMDDVGPLDVAGAAILAGFGAWAVHSGLSMAGKARWWPFVATTLLSISVAGPGWLAQEEAVIPLVVLHFTVAIPLIIGFARLSTCEDYGYAGQAGSTGEHNG